MKAVMVMYDSLNREMLSPYGCDWIPTPNFHRLAEHSVTFDRNYVGSMPCMPARRELHTGRYNFEHRSWGPIEPFDDSMPEILRNNGIYSHLSTDHDHYWQDGGATYHSRYSSFDFSRGQEGDTWKVNPALVEAVQQHRMPGRVNYYDLANREYMDRECRMSQAVTFQAGLEFIEKHHSLDNWFLQIETFDPHEPFFTQPEWKERFAHEYKGELGDWPPYYFDTEGEDAVAHMRMEYAALITMCDHYLGKVLDKMDEYDLWKDTLLIVNTDHGFLLGEHGWWSKSIMPVYEEISHTPFFLFDPRCPGAAGSRRAQLTQTIDIAPTVLDFFGLPIPKDMEGKSLLPVVEEKKAVHDYVLFGYHDGHCNITDGRWVYMKAPIDSAPFYEYTLMPTHMAARFSVQELQEMELAGAFSFTKNVKTLKIRAKEGMNHQANFGSKLFDLQSDPRQEAPLIDDEKAAELANEMLRLMRADDCPKERFARFGFPAEGSVTAEQMRALREAEETDRIPRSLSDLSWERAGINMYAAIARFLPVKAMPGIDAALRQLAGDDPIGVNTMARLIGQVIPPENQPIIFYFAMLASRTV